MNTGVYILFLGFMVYFRSAHTSQETVWLKDVTTRFQTNKRPLDDPNLPSQLTFHIKGVSFDLTLNLRRNFEIDPNADIYVLQKMNDGQSIFTKARNLGREDVAYYHDRENGAYMTVRCIKRSNQQCERVISGNLQIEDNSYHLQPVDTINSSDNLKEISDITGKRYLLLDQDNIQLQTLVDTKDAANVIRTNVLAKSKALFGRFTGMDKQNPYRRSESTLSSRYVANLHDRDNIDNTRQLKSYYYVKVAVLIDSSIWNLYSSRDKTQDPLRKSIEVQKRIREAFSHIINGVNLHYKSIEDPHIAITIILQSFTFFEKEAMFPHIRSKVFTIEGNKRIEAYHYLYDIGDWANKTTELQPVSYDHVMLFTRYHLFDRENKMFVEGVSLMNGVCDVMAKISVIRVSHYVKAVKTAAHELGHNLGAEHDGYGEARACKAADLFIMTPKQPMLSKIVRYVDNNWKFSICSIESFRTKLKYKECVKAPGPVFNMAEWTSFMTKEAGDVFTPNELCYFVYGPGSKFTGELSKEICYLSSCKHPDTGIHMKAYLNAARGTKCGDNKWCIDGRCVPKDST